VLHALRLRLLANTLLIVSALTGVARAQQPEVNSSCYFVRIRPSTWIENSVQHEKKRWSFKDGILRISVDLPCDLIEKPRKPILWQERDGGKILIAISVRAANCPQKPMFSGGTKFFEYTAEELGLGTKFKAAQYTEDLFQPIKDRAEYLQVIRKVRQQEAKKATPNPNLLHLLPCAKPPRQSCVSAVMDSRTGEECTREKMPYADPDDETAPDS